MSFTKINKINNLKKEPPKFSGVVAKCWGFSFDLVKVGNLGKKDKKTIQKSH